MKTQLLNITRALTLICLTLFVQRSVAQNGLDPDFGQDGTVLTSFGTSEVGIRAIIQLSDNKLLAVGEAYSSNAESALLARYLVDGTLDASFGTEGSVTFMVNGSETYLDNAIVDASGKIYVVGEVQTGSNGYSGAVIRLTSNGDLDTSFGNNGAVLTTFGTALDAVVTDIAVQPDGQIVVSGVVDDNSDPVYDELADFALARYNTDGTLDTSFGNAGYVITTFNANHYDALLSILLLPDGKIVASGFSFTEDPNTFEDSSDVVAARYNADGSLDTSFGNDGKVIINVGDFDYIEGMALQSDGKILLCGDTTIISQEIDDSLIVRLNADGSLDTSFSNDGVVITPFLNSAENFSSAHTVIANADGSILAVGGAFDNEGNEYYNTIAKYNANGTLDTSFRDDGKFEFQNNEAETYDAIVTNAGKLLLAGSKFVYDGTDGTSYFYISQFLLSNTLGIDDFTLNPVSIYPNPVATSLNISFETATNTRVELYDTLGKVVATLHINTKNNSMDLTNLSAGIYYLQVFQNGQTFTEKIIKN